ncbi:MAG TPA: hypothetical protein PL187_10495 [Caldilinea sp.]|nr:hypothetical protein [Anaerolineales bacterium]HRA66441.1 hypothetical protein [Caldilinea sp.]
MGIFSRLAAIFSGKAPGGSDRYLPIYVIDHRCREPIAGQIDLLNELSVVEEETGGGYFVRKVLHTSGEQRCFSQVEVQLWLDSKKRIVEQEVQGGRWLTAEEYAAEVARQAAEAEEAARQAAEAEAAASQLDTAQDFLPSTTNPEADDSTGPV